MKMGKKFTLRSLSLLALILMMIGISTQALALNATNANAETTVETLFPALQGNLEDANNTEDVSTIDVDLDCFKDSTTEVDIPKQKSGYQLNSVRGRVTGTLTSADPWNYYVFTKNTNFKGSMEFNPDDSSYTMTLGLADYTTGQISLSDIVLTPGHGYVITFSPLPDDQDYAWVIQSPNESYGSSYSFTYDNEYTDAFYVAPNGDEYAVRNQKMYRNDSLVNLDYRYDVSFSNQYGYHERHIWMENANVRPIHVGAVEWYASAQRRYYDNVIVLQVLPGGTFTHHFYQNPPYMNWGHTDAAGIMTPRAITSTDLSERGGHYLIYDIDQGKTIQFASGLSANWTRNVGDLHDLKLL